MRGALKANLIIKANMLVRLAAQRRTLFCRDRSALLELLLSNRPIRLPPAVLFASSKTRPLCTQRKAKSFCVSFVSFSAVFARSSWCCVLLAMRFSPSQPSAGPKGRQMHDAESSSRDSERRKTFSSAEEKNYFSPCMPANDYHTVSWWCFRARREKISK